MDKFFFFFIITFFAAFVFTRVFSLMEMSFPNTSTGRKIFNALSSMMVFLILMSPCILAVTGYILDIFSFTTSMIIIVVYNLILILVGTIIFK